MKMYPEDDVLFYIVDTPDKKIPVTLFGREKSGFILGYEQAEKDMLEIVKEYVKKGVRCMDQSADADDQGGYTFWDGFHNCAENILRELKDE